MSDPAKADPAKTDSAKADSAKADRATSDQATSDQDKADSGMNDLRVSGVSKAYGSGAPVLDRLDLAVPGGSLAAVLGPSGCGKTTLLRVIAGFLKADAGSVAVAGRVLGGPGVHLPPERRRIGIVPQEGALFPHLSVARNVAFGLRELDRAAKRTRVGEMLDLVGLAGYGDRMPNELSGGQQQRIALARALAPQPHLVLLDEPFSALDSGLRGAVRAEVRAVLKESGATALLVTHDQQEALSTADLVAVVREGRVAQCATPEDLYHRPVDPWLASFVGDAVLVPGTAEKGIATTPLGRIPLAAAPDGLRDGVVLLRPEQLQLIESDVAAAGGAEGVVTDVCFFGHDVMVTVSVDGLERPVGVRTPSRLQVTTGQRVGVRLTGTATLHRHTT